MSKITKEQIELYLEYKEEKARLDNLEKQTRIALGNDLVDYLNDKKIYDATNKKIKCNLEGYSFNGKIPTNYKIDKESLLDQLGFNFTYSKNNKLTLVEVTCFDIKIELNESRYKKYKEEVGGNFAHTELCKLVTESDGLVQLEIKKID